MFGSSRRGFLLGMFSHRFMIFALCALPFGTFVPAAVADTGMPLPNLLVAIDGHGVDQASGLFNAPRLNVDIGTKDSGLSLASVMFDDNFEGWVAAEVDDQPYVYTEVALGGKTYRFATGDLSQTTTTRTISTTYPYQPAANESVISSNKTYVQNGDVCSSMRLNDTTEEHYVLEGGCGNGDHEYYYYIYSINYTTTVVDTNTIISSYPSGTYNQKGNNGNAATLSLQNGVYTLTLSDGTQAFYTNYLLTKVVRPDGEQISIDYYYDSSGNVLLEANPRVTDSVSYKTSIGTNTSTTTTNYARPVKQAIYSSLGWGMRFDVDTSNGNRATKITAFNRSVSNCQESASSCTQFGTEASVARLADSSGTTTFYLNNTPQISLTSTPAQLTLTTPMDVKKVVNMGTATVNGQVLSGKVTSVVQAGSTWSYQFSNSANYLTTISNPDKTSFSNFHDYKNELYIVDELGRRTQYEYYDATTGFRRSDVLPPESASAAQNSSGEYYGAVHYTYDARGNITEIRKVAKNGSSLGDIVQTASFDTTCNNPKTCNQPNYTIDANGNRTDYTYDGTTGLLKTVTGPADASGVRPQTRYGYTPMYAQVLNSSGVLGNAEAQVNKLTSLSTCKTATAADSTSCVGTAGETLTTYAYNNNNLLMTSQTVAGGNGSSTATISYTYDNVGNVVSVKGPRTDVDDTRYTTYDSWRRPVYEIGVLPGGPGSPHRTAVHHVYDSDGHETQTETGYASSDATDGSDFVVTSFKRMTYDSTSGLLVKTEVVQP